MNLESKDEGDPHISAIPNLDAFLKAPDSGSHAGVALEYIRITSGGTSRSITLNVTNVNGGIDFLDKGNIIESDCTVHRDGSVLLRYAQRYTRACPLPHRYHERV